MPRVPEIRDRLDLSLGGLGAVLLGTGLGGLLASVAGGALVDRLGSRRACVLAAAVLSAALPLIGYAPTALALAATLAFLGAVDVVTDIGMNVQAAQVQRRSTGSVIQRFHAAWSIGAVVGAGVASATAGVGVSLRAQLTVTGAVLVAVVAVARRWLCPVDDAPAPAEGGARRRSVLGLLAAVAICLAIVEGAPGDWAAVFGREVHGAGPGVAGLGFLAVSAGMVVGRLSGDRATDRLGPVRVFRGALGLAAVGLSLVVTSPAIGVAVAGFSVIGVGVSVLFPALYLRAADTAGVPSGLGLGVMSTGARFGFLASPVVVGTVAEATSLRSALAGVIGAAIVAALAFDARLTRAGRAAT